MDLTRCILWEGLLTGLEELAEREKMIGEEV